MAAVLQRSATGASWHGRLGRSHCTSWAHWGRPAFRLRIIRPAQQRTAHFPVPHVQVAPHHSLEVETITTAFASNISCVQPLQAEAESGTPAAASPAQHPPGQFADFMQPVDVVIDTWLGAAALNHLVGSTLYTFYVDSISIAQKVVDVLAKDWDVEAWEDWVLPSYAVVGGCVWGTLLLTFLSLVPARVLKNSSKTSVSMAAAVSMAVILASAAGKETEGLLVIPGCFPWVAVLAPFFCASIGVAWHGWQRAAWAGGGPWTTLWASAPGPRSSAGHPPLCGAL